MNVLWTVLINFIPPVLPVIDRIPRPMFAGATRQPGGRICVPAQNASLPKIPTPKRERKRRKMKGKRRAAAGKEVLCCTLLSSRPDGGLQLAVSMRMRLADMCAGYSFHVNRFFFHRRQDGISWYTYLQRIGLSKWYHVCGTGLPIICRQARCCGWCLVTSESGVLRREKIWRFFVVFPPATLR